MEDWRAQHFPPYTPEIKILPKVAYASNTSGDGGGADGGGGLMGSGGGGGGVFGRGQHRDIQYA